MRHARTRYHIFATNRNPPGRPQKSRPYTCSRLPRDLGKLLVERYIFIRMDTTLCPKQDCQKNRTTDPEALHLTLTKNEKTDRSRIARGIVLRLRSNCKLKFQIAIIWILDMWTLDRIRPVDRCVETFRNLFS